MQPRAAAAIGLVLVLIVLLAVVLFGGGGAALPPTSPVDGAAEAAAQAPATGAIGDPAAGARTDGQDGLRTAVVATRGGAGVRGIVLDAETARPLGGIEVLALRQQPSFEPLMNRFRGLFQGGMFTETHRPPQILGRTLSAADGTFELQGLPDGLVFLDGRSDGHYVRTPGSARLAPDEMVEGVELRASPAGRVRGIVLGVDGAPVAGAAVSLRPGLNAFLGQLTDRKYRWLETATDQDGRFDIPGVPTGNGYTASASAPTIALEEQHGIGVQAGQVTEVVLRGHQGAVVSGRVFDPAGEPVVGANVAMIYLDISRVLFSADGRSEPLRTDEDGRFSLRPVAAGRVAFVAAADGLAPSSIAELAVVDGGVYPDLELRLGDGTTVRGIVVDDEDRPIAGAAVELRPFERPDDPQFLKMMLKIRRVEVATDADGKFEARGMTGDRLVVQAGKPGYTTCMRFGVRLDEDPVRMQLQRGAVVRGRVVDAAGEPVTRFRIDTRSRPPQPDGEKATDGDSAPTWEEDGDRGDRGGARMEFRMGGGRGRDRGPMRERTVQLPEGQTMADRGMNMGGNWREIAAADGRFELRGIPPGSVRVRVRADGCLDPDNQTVLLAPGQESAELVFELAAGLAAGGRVVDAATGKPVSDAQVTAYRQRDDGDGGRGMFRMSVDPEDMDFLGLSSTQGRRSAMTDSKGAFAIEALAEGTYRFTARHPDLAKSSAKDVEIRRDRPVPAIEITLDAGGGVEGVVSGALQRPVVDAVIVAFSMQSGTLRSSTTDARGYYRIDGLPPGQYAVFKSRMDERADNIPLELMSNMRLKTVTVRQGQTARLDIEDEREDGVRVHGVVRENGAPVPRALVTLLGTDRDGIFGMGVRAKAAGDDGRYELVGIAPGSYVVQVTRFQGRPVQTSLQVDVPFEQLDFRYDIDLPSSEVQGRVVDSRGNPVPRAQVSLGAADGGRGGDGLLGMIVQGGLSQGRTDDDGVFRLRSVSAGTYDLRVGQRGDRGRRAPREGEVRHGSAVLEDVVVDGVTSVQGLVVTVPIAGRITGSVVDGSGAPVRAAEIFYAADAASSAPGRNPIAGLFGMQERPIVTDEDGHFAIEGLNPGTYDLRVDTEALEAGSLQDVEVHEDAATAVELRIVRGATLRVRATNVDKSSIPLAWISLLDGNGQPVVHKVSTLTVLRRLMAGRDQVEDSGWYEYGSVPPDTYALVITEPGKPELRISRTIADGERVEWDVDVAAELAARDKDR
ncbi:MAG: carboxypeptidase regulatory-like domain-containing protein [Planctomycetota bacterium]